MATPTDEAIERRIRVPPDVFRKVEAVRAHRSFNAFTVTALEQYALREALILAGGKPTLTVVPADPASSATPSREHRPHTDETDPLVDGEPSQSTAPGEQAELDVNEPRRRQPPRPCEEWGS